MYKRQVYQVDDETVARTILKTWIYRFGTPERLVSDQGGNVAGELIQELCRLLNVQKIRTTPYHPQGNGKAERAIITVKGLLQSMIGELGRKWPEQYFLQLDLPSVEQQDTWHIAFFLGEKCASLMMRGSKDLKK